MINRQVTVARFTRNYHLSDIYMVGYPTVITVLIEKQLKKLNSISTVSEVESLISDTKVPLQRDRRKVCLFKTIIISFMICKILPLVQNVNVED